MTINTIIFDLDGTLVNTAPDLLLATNHVLVQNGYPAITMNEMRPIISYGAKAMIAKGFEAAEINLPPDQHDKLFLEFVEYYTDNIAIDSHAFDGLEDFLKQCQSAGFRLGVCTNKREAMSIKLLSELGLADYFASVIGPDTIGVGKPDPAPFFETVKQVGGNIENSVMIGDSATDINTAINAGVKSVAVSFGYTDIPVAKLGADAIIDHYDELWGVIASL